MSLPQPKSMSPDGVPNAHRTESATPTVVVDLDGTLAKVDTLHEELLHVFLRHPLKFCGLFLAPKSSWPRFKDRIAELATDEPKKIPFNEDVIRSLLDAPGEKVICTASNYKSAARTCANLTFHSAIFGSDSKVNLKGKNKADFLEQKFGRRQFVYYGDAAADLPVWAAAAKAVVVGNNRSLVERTRKVCAIVQTIPANRPGWLRTILRASRPHQWTKNLLVFVPILAAHRVQDTHLLVRASAMFAVLCLLSSSVYIFNDLLDLAADRQHPTKSKRPFAAGDLGVGTGLVLSASFALLSLSGASLLGKLPLAICIGYGLLAVLYSAKLKTYVLLDVFVLGLLYTLRLFAGGAVASIIISMWLAAFSIFIFLSLALCKRYIELVSGQEIGGQLKNRRGYEARDAAFVMSQGLIYMGCASLVLSVYLNSTAVTALYQSPSILWFAVLIISYWGGRLWLRASRQMVHEDPVLFAITDPASWTCLAALVAVYLLASFL